MPTIICIFIRVKRHRNDIHMWRQLKGFKVFLGGWGRGTGASQVNWNLYFMRVMGGWFLFLMLVLWWPPFEEA
jgi:hypothetical protein